LPDVYKCAIEGTLLMSRGVSSHMKKIHGLESDQYGVPNGEKDCLDLVILRDDVPRGNTGLEWVKGYTVAKWMFEFQGELGIRFIRGDLNTFKFWVNGRIRHVARKKRKAVDKNLKRDEEGNVISKVAGRRLIRRNLLLTYMEDYL